MISTETFQQKYEHAAKKLGKLQLDEFNQWLTILHYGVPFIPDEFGKIEDIEGYKLAVIIHSSAIDRERNEAQKVDALRMALRNLRII